MSNVSLRRPSADEAPVLLEIFQAARRDAMPYLPELHTDEDTLGWLRNVVLAGQEVWIATLDDGAPAGFAALSEIVLEHLYVVPVAQRQGVGSALLARARERRPEGFRFWVFQRNKRARRFYEARGCALVELTDGSGNEEREPDALYEWRPVRIQRMFN